MTIARVHDPLSQTLINKLGVAGGPRADQVGAELDNIYSELGLIKFLSFFSDPTTVATDANTNEKDFSTKVVAANTLAADGDFLIALANVQYAANANTKRYRIYFGSNAVFDTGAVAFNNVNHFIIGFMMRRATTFITTSWGSLTTAAGTGSGAQFAEFGSNNFAASITVKSTGQNGTASAGDITQRGFILLKGGV